MSVSIQLVAVTSITRGLKTLSALLDKAKAHADEAGTSPDAYVEMRLFDDMLPLSGQIQRASDTAKGAIARLSGVEAPAHGRRGKDPGRPAGAHRQDPGLCRKRPGLGLRRREDRQVVVPAGSFTLGFTGLEYLLEFVVPNFQFHVVTAYDILRHKGVPLGKRDFLGIGPERVKEAA
jgi:hypothetical protein